MPSNNLSDPYAQAVLQGWSRREPRPNPWPGNPNAYECPWGCNGTGSMPWFSHIQGGVCFHCRGEGWILGRGSRPAPVKRSTSGRRWRKEGGRIVPA
jgi:hypothetical protein